MCLSSGAAARRPARKNPSTGILIHTREKIRIFPPLMRIYVYDTIYLFYVYISRSINSFTLKNSESPASPAYIRYLSIVPV